MSTGHVSAAPIRIDHEFKLLIPSTPYDELIKLECDLSTEGCLEPLVVWKGQGVLLDGHKRFDICRGIGVEFDVVEIELPDRDAAKAWVLRKQLQRENLHSYLRCEIALRLDNLSAASGESEGADGRSSDGLQGTDHRLARVAGVSFDTIRKARLLFDEAGEATKARLRRGEDSVNKVYQQLARLRSERVREARRAEYRDALKPSENGDAASFGAVRFSTIVAHPPWELRRFLDGAGATNRPEKPMSLAEIGRLPIADLADEDCHLYLSTPNRFLPDGFHLMAQWGFRQVTLLTWERPILGVGPYFRSSANYVLFGVKGTQPLQRDDVGTCFAASAEAVKGGRRPREFYELVESCSPGPYVELFADPHRAEWAAWRPSGLCLFHPK